MLYGYGAHHKVQGPASLERRIENLLTLRKNEKKGKVDIKANWSRKKIKRERCFEHPAGFHPSDI